MPYTSQELQQIAIGVVAECQPCKPYDLLDRLKREYGASHGEANKTMLLLIRDGRLKRSFFGELTLPGGAGRTGGASGRLDPMKLIIYIVFMSGILGFMAWVFYRLFLGG